MLQFLQTGKALYVLAVICGLGIISKLVTGGLYKRLIKETENMVLTKNKNLRLLKQRTENAFLISHNLRNTSAYIEKQLYSFKFMNLSLDSWDNLAIQAMILCFLVGGIAAFGAYWYRCDSYYIVLYGTMGILGGLLLVLVDHSVNVSLKRQQLSDCLVEYMENSPHFNRPADKYSGVNEERRTPAAKNVAETSKHRLNDIGRRGKLKVVEEFAAAEEHVPSREPEMEPSARKLPILARKKGRKAPSIRQTSAETVKKKLEVPKDSVQKPMDEALMREEELRKSIDGLKQSLEQIAAAREETQKNVSPTKVMEPGAGGQTRKEITPENIKFLDEILQEYFL